MAVKTLNCSFNGSRWETEPLKCLGGDVRLRVHKSGPFPVNLLVSIDGVEEYIKYDDFGFDLPKCEITLEGVMAGQFIKLSSRSELTLVKYMEQ